MTAGRPTEYGPEIEAKCHAYFTHCEENSDLPQIAGLAVYLQVHRDTLYEWGKVHPEFSDILGKLMAAQEYNLVKNGLEGKYNSTITKLMLTKHGYTDKQDVTTGGNPLPILNVLGDNSDKEDKEAKEEN